MKVEENKRGPKKQTKKLIDSKSKAAKEKGKKKQDQQKEKEKRHYRYRPGTVALREIKHYQKST